ncbi:galanin receptor type 1-like [Stylophora pistillata]|uniref:galanin receptor type 1-like n=1 Tax=Stylophora pistillata TaxID=50429 RepID=UPI000C054317|nr:galanin receptor type 1-like [Stylophora pistillata]
MNGSETVSAGPNRSFPTVFPHNVQGESQAFSVIKIFFYFIILSASTFGNSMLAHIIIHTRKMRTASNFLILNLAICDLVTPLISIVFDFILEENNYDWIYGEAMCSILWPTQTYFTCASSLTLAGISLDRYRIILHPFKIRLTSKQISLLIFLVHVCSLVAVAPYGYFLVLRNGSCEENWPKFSYRQAYTFFLFLVQYAMPLVIMIFMYTMAVRALCQTSRKTRDNSICAKTPQFIVKKLKLEAKQQEKHRGLSKSHYTFIRRLGKLNTRDIWKTPNARATKMFIVIVTVFAIFMFPNQIVWLWADFGGGINHPDFTKLSIICWLFTYTNSVVNPVIFGLFSKDFRKGFRRIFHSLLRCERLVGKEDLVRLRRQSTSKTRSETTESHGTDYGSCTKDSNMSCLFQDEQKTPMLGGKTDHQFHEMSPPLAQPNFASNRTAIKYFSKQMVPNPLKAFELEDATRHSSGLLRENYVEQWGTLSNSESYIETLTDALNSSPETNC